MTSDQVGKDVSGSVRCEKRKKEDLPMERVKIGFGKFAKEFLDDVLRGLEIGSEKELSWIKWMSTHGIGNVGKNTDPFQFKKIKELIDIHLKTFQCHI